jgi:hypothetical protein
MAGELKKLLDAGEDLFRERNQDRVVIARLKDYSTC